MANRDRSMRASPEDDVMSQFNDRGGESQNSGKDKKG